MTFSGLTSGTLPHHNKYASRQGRGITRVIVHHWAGTVGGDTSLASPGRDASTNYILYGDGRLVGQVPEEYRAWTSGSWEADSYSITIEVQNSTNGPDWKVSDKAIAKLATLIADIAKRYKWGTITRDRVRGHREFAATACPGPYLYPRLGAIAQNAEKIRTGNTDPLGGIMSYYTNKKAFRDDLMHLIRYSVPRAKFNAGIKDTKGNPIVENLASSLRRAHTIGRANRIKNDRIEGKVDALGVAIEQLSGGQIDMAAIEKAAFDGASKGAADVEAREVAELLQVSVRQDEIDTEELEAFLDADDSDE